MDRNIRLPAFLVGQFAVLAALAALVAAMLELPVFGDSHVGVVVTTPAVGLALRTLGAVGLLAVALYALVPIGLFATGRDIEDRSRVWLAIGFALVGPPALAAVGVGALLVGYAVGRIVVGALFVAGLPGLGWIVARLLGWVDGSDATRTLTALAAGVACLGLIVGLTVSAGALDGLTVDHRTGTPVAAFEFSYEPINDTHGRLTITHGGGDAIDRDRLRVRGSGFATVDGVDRTRPGPWTGESLPGDPPLVQPGNATTVGVSADCEVEVLFDDGRQKTTLDRYECGASG